MVQVSNVAGVSGLLVRHADKIATGPNALAKFPLASAVFPSCEAVRAASSATFTESVTWSTVLACAAVISPACRLTVAALTARSSAVTAFA